MRALLLPAALLAAACGQPTAQPAAPAEEGTPQPQVRLHGVRLKYFKGADLVASGTADELTCVTASSGFVASSLALRLPARGSPSGALDLAAPLAKGALGDRQVDGEGGVVLRTSSGLVARTPRAHIDGVASSASGAEEVDVDGAGYRLSSRGFTVDFPSERYTFESRVRSRFGPAR